jgi:membrane protease YdiL (CAAX protease family)
MTAGASVAPVIIRLRVHVLVAMLLLASLLALRFPLLLLTALPYAHPVIPAWANRTFDFGTYALTALLIWWERRRLAEFHIDRLALVFIVLIKPLFTISQTFFSGISGTDWLALPSLPALACWVIAIILAILLLRDRRSLPPLAPHAFRWVGIAILAALAYEAVIAYPYARWNNITGSQDISVSSFVTLGMAVNFSFDLSFAALSEEPLFRGFLWGYLRQAGLREAWIWLIQAGLFVLGHLYHIVLYPFSFWVVVPTGALLFGWMAWRSRTIASSMLVHALTNTLLVPVAIVVAHYFVYGLK